MRFDSPGNFGPAHFTMCSDRAPHAAHDRCLGVAAPGPRWGEWPTEVPDEADTPEALHVAEHRPY